MNASKNLEAQLTIARRLLNGDNDEASTLAALVLEMHNYLSKCGDPPMQWRAGLNANASGATFEDYPVIECTEVMLERCGICGHHVCTCLEMEGRY